MELESSESNEIPHQMDNILFIVTLEESLLQLKIVEACANLPKTIKKGEEEKLKLVCEKLATDRRFVKKVLRDTIIELADFGTSNTLAKAAESLKQKLYEAENERMQYSENQMVKEVKKKEHKIQRKNWREQLKMLDHQIVTLRDQKEDQMLNSKMRLRYADKWLLARSEAIEHRLHNTAVSKPKPNLKNEERVHKELLKAYAIQIKELDEKIVHWQEKYDKDIKRMDLALIEKRDLLDAKVAVRKELQSVYDKKKGEMDAYLKIKNEKLKRLALEKKKRESAIRLQAWWRGMMVMKALGSFRYLRNMRRISSKTKKK